MNDGQYVFAQLVQFIDKYEFNKCVRRYNGDYHIRDLNCWQLLLQLFFGQLTNRRSLRDICVCLKAHQNKLYHMGLKNYDHTSLSRANETRDWRIFADYGNYMIQQVRPLYSGGKFDEDIDIENAVLALDSTTISVSINLFEWAEGKYSRGAVKAHTMIDLRESIPVFLHVTDGCWHDSNAMDLIEIERHAIYVMDKAYVDLLALDRINNEEAFFVTRAKDNMRIKIVETYDVDADTGIWADQKVCFATPKSKSLYPNDLRFVQYLDEEKQELFMFITNNFELPALIIATLYKNRWQIEVFFKWIKQHLVVKTLWGHSENAVKIHIWMALITYLTIACVKHTIQSKLSIYEITQILGISTTDKTSLKELLTETTHLNQDVKEQLDLFYDL